MTFDELFAEHNLTQAERDALVAYLASLRMLATMRALLPTQQGPRQAFGGMRDALVGGTVQVCPECDIANCRHIRAAIPAPASGGSDGR